jgi:hypothetical protein
LRKVRDICAAYTINTLESNNICEAFTTNTLESKVEEIANPLTQQIRYLDKLIDELAKDKTLDNIFRK